MKDRLRLGATADHVHVNDGLDACSELRLRVKQRDGSDLMGGQMKRSVRAGRASLPSLISLLIARATSRMRRFRWRCRWRPVAGDRDDN